MKEILQLNLTEKEAIILQAITAVGIVIHLNGNTEPTAEEEANDMERFMRKWPEADKSLAVKMAELAISSLMLIKTK